MLVVGFMELRGIVEHQESALCAKVAVHGNR
jgi:hypothetical protein